MPEENDLYKKVVEKLSTVIDPETGADVIRMRLVQNIQIDSSGKVTYFFRPSSPLCPLAVPLSLAITRAVSEVPGVTDQEITVLDYTQAEQLNQLLKDYLHDQQFNTNRRQNG